MLKRSLVDQQFEREFVTEARTELLCELHSLYSQRIPKLESSFWFEIVDQLKYRGMLRPDYVCD